VIKVVRQRKIFDPDADEVNDAWKKVQDRCGIKFGDVEPLVDLEFEQRVKQFGMTKKEMENFALRYYMSYPNMCKKLKGKVRKPPAPKPITFEYKFDD
jgi:hypothetical protein